MSASSEDREEIRELYARYCLYFDQGKATEWANLYTEDGEFVGAGQHLRGRRAMETFLAELPHHDTHRVTCNHIIELHGDRALCRSSVLLLSGSTIVSSGRTEDQLERVEGAWRIARRIFTSDQRPPPEG